ncbi:minor capsid protein [Aeromicrobium sp. 9AM]|uniref:minor capsid protein n=1 Tax=Aeromicrobium sp. 9AM TaxID=2653126 RepID=UPI0012F1C29B|nr:minor capsid protein [Aeromicrobium sp. 9AM]VXB81948.1 conserved hypothetical protein [Aeromicrobium sp. 9AM]
MGFTDDLLTGLAQDLVADGIGTWRSNGKYQAAEVGIVLGFFPDQPSDIIALTPYGVTASAVGDDIQGVQVRTRRDGQDPRPAMALADAIYERWHMRHNVTLTGGVYVTQITWQSSVSGGRDANGRNSLIQNFYVQHPRILPHRP